jgi:hypothetical protein
MAPPSGRLTSMSHKVSDPRKSRGATIRRLTGFSVAFDGTLQRTER